MNCEACKENRANVPYIVHESAEARHERREKRLLIAVLIAVILLFASNAMWLCAWMQYDYAVETESYSVDMDAGDGIATYVGEDGGINYGTNSSYQDENPQDTHTP
jgi:hypothetical protein